MYKPAILILLLNLFCSAVIATSNNGEANTRPNVIVILADDMRAGVTGFEGHPIIKTPNIDGLAEKGMVFSTAFANSAVCTSSRTTLLSGLYERRHGINFNSNSSMINEN